MFTHRALKYAEQIQKGKIPACKHVINACTRFISDLKRKDIFLDADKAEEWCEFLEKLPHTKGKWAAQSEKLVLSDWQLFCTVNIFGFYVKKTGRRRF